MSRTSFNPRDGEAIYYDGRSPVGSGGRLHLDANAIFFSPLDKSKPTQQIPLADIAELSKIAGGFRIETRKRGEDEVPVQIEFGDPVLFERIQRALDELHSSCRKRFLRRLDRSSIVGKLAFAAAAIAIMGFTLVRGVEYSHHFLPVSVDEALGQRVYPRVVKQFTVCTNKPLEDALGSMLQSLTDSSDRFTHKLTIVQSPIQNAMALPGGDIFVFSGLLAASESPEEIYGILAHEVAHVELRHSLRTFLRTSGLFFASSLVVGAGFDGAEAVELIAEFSNTLLALKYSRGYEREADILAAKKLNKQKVSLDGLIAFFKRNQIILKKDSGWNTVLRFLSSHPMSSERMEYLEKLSSGQKSEASLKSIGISALHWDAIKRGCVN